MGLHLPPIDAGSPLKLAGSLDIYDAVLLRETLLHFVEERSEIALDLSGIEECDLTTIQLIFAARKYAEAAGKPFSIVSVSAAITQACLQLGVEPVSA